MIVFFRDEKGKAPFLEWFDDLPERAKVQCRARLELLASLGHQLRRPAADYLRDGIHELRSRVGRVQYRVLYFFHGRLVVITHGITKHEPEVPAIEIEKARRRRMTFESDPQRHTHREVL